MAYAACKQVCAAYESGIAASLQPLRKCIMAAVMQDYGSASLRRDPVWGGVNLS